MLSKLYQVIGDAIRQHVFQTVRDAIRAGTTDALNSVADELLARPQSIDIPALRLTVEPDATRAAQPVGSDSRRSATMKPQPGTAATAPRGRRKPVAS